MLIKVIDWLVLIKRTVRLNARWMTWNLCLAFVPLVLSIWLFRISGSRSLLWWIGLLVFVAFLPNAPYVLTDIIHLIRDIRRESSIWTITLILIPQYSLFMLAGFEAYVLSLINLGHYLNQQGQRRLIIFAEFLLHTLSAIGIYLGRFLRFNSWDFVTQPDAILDSTVEGLLAKWPLLVIAITFVVIVGLYWIMKEMTLATLLRRRYTKALSTDMAKG
jgi:uncharacterized membrane protein